MSNSKIMSIKEFCDFLSFIPPENESAKLYQCCSHHTKQSASATEMLLATRQHRWKDVRELQNEFFKATADYVEKYMVDALRVFKLPSVEQIEASIAGEDVDESGIFKLDKKMLTSYRRIVSQFQEDMVGDNKFLKSFENIKQAGLEDMPLYQFHMLSSFGLGQKHTMRQILDALPENTSAELREAIAANVVMPQLENKYLAAMIKDGTKRIKTITSKKMLQAVRKEMITVAKEGRGPYDAARFLYKNYKGNFWEWLRITRSEPVLALNVAYKEQGKLSRVRLSKWSAAPGACPICSAFDGHVWPFGESPEPVISTHPHCFQWFTKVYTSSGWIKIKDIKIGDLVLTHKGRFKKVIKKHKHTEKKGQKMIRLKYINESYNKNKINKPVVLELTDNHPILVNNRWQDAKNAKKGDTIKLLATRCNFCDKLIPYSRWRNADGYESKFCSNSCQTESMINKYGGEYLTKNFHDNRKVLIKNGKHHFQKNNLDFIPWIYKPKKETTEIRKKISKNKKEYYKRYPNKILDLQKMARNRPSKPQKKLYNLILKYYPNALLEEKINTKYGVRWGDIVMPDYNLILEYDGEYWHKNKDKDLQRDLELNSSGWTVLHFNKQNWKTAPEQIERILKSHNGDYEFIDFVLSGVEHYEMKWVDLYNLSIQDDESFIAKGFVVHNCFCLLIPLYETKQPVQNQWDQASPYDRPYVLDRGSGAAPIADQFGLTPIMPAL